VNRRQAARLHQRLAERFPDAPVVVTPIPNGAQILIKHEDDFDVRVTTGDMPGPVLRAMLGRDLRAVEADNP
jgi:hypothetical protein